MASSSSTNRPHFSSATRIQVTGILPTPLLPPFSADQHHQQQQQPRPATSAVDFDRSIHQQRRHYDTRFRDGDGQEQRLFTSLGRARFEPEYPRYSQVHRVESAHEPMSNVAPVTCRRPFPDMSNVESIRDTGDNNSMTELPGSRLPAGIPKVIKVRDPKTNGATLMRFRQGVELDFLKSAGVPHIRRYDDSYRDEEAAFHRRGGIGFAKQMDRYYREVEYSDKFFTEKPDRFWSGGEKPKISFGGNAVLAPTASSSGAATPIASRGGGGGLQTNNTSYQPPPSRGTQMQANSAAMRALQGQKSRPM